MSIVVKLLDCIRTKWQHSNWEVRRTAVMTSSGCDINKLRRIVKKDKHPLVREEAFRKLNDPSFLTDLAHHRRFVLVVFIIAFMFFLLCRVAIIPKDTGGQDQPPTNI